MIVRDFAPNRHVLDARFGKVLGRGAYRVVYPLGRDCVVKYEHNANANSREWNVWQAVKGTDLAKYLCPIYSKSSDDRTLIQARCREVFEKHTSRISSEIAKIYYSNRDDNPRMVAKIRRLNAERDAWNDKLRAFAREVEAAFQNVGIRASDIHEGNVGYDRDGNMIVIDYGNFFFMDPARGATW